MVEESIEKGNCMTIRKENNDRATLRSSETGAKHETSLLDESDRFLEEMFNTPGMLVMKEEEPGKSHRKKKIAKRPKRKKKPVLKKKTAEVSDQQDATKRPPPKKMKKKPKRKEPTAIPFDVDIPLLPGEKVEWTGTHDKASDIKGYIGFAMAASLAIFCLQIALTSKGTENIAYWNTFLVVLVIFVIFIFSTTTQSTEGCKFLSGIQIMLAAISALLIALTYLSVLYEQLAAQYRMPTHPGAPEDMMSFSNLPISSLIFMSMVLFLFVILTSLKTGTPKQYNRCMTAAAIVILLTGTAYFFEPELLEQRNVHTTFALNIFVLILFLFSFVLFFGLVTKKTRFIITNKRFVLIRLYLGKEVWLKSYGEMDRVTAKQGIVGARYGFGTITLYTTTHNRRPHILILDGVPEPFKAEHILHTRISRTQTRRR